MAETVNPKGWPRPRGYSNGVSAHGRVLAIAGQIGWNERNELVSSDFAEQTAQALRNVMTVLRAAGGDGDGLIRMTWYVTDKHAYRAASEQIGKDYREIVGACYPAMTLVQVADLLEDGALVEIEATAVIP
jgi:enamine deaminase RidA (YjgF/YER057c/UK114 family)